eukprot:CAMPEP_0202857922 /NCGR_PEP_ID=MMETSP1391-20130828/672_1 /ASSEMBLY_ACC=CAM_ASM_000867 /TAXON_ID=1034604 /ORGANISM="Chlamydomonas leiostraca, Strain SAG 11-49" /LENGTH=50 /DNA_ID=CAMNT_0049536787 /DNA_START=4663 /DNA_END=4815 /DNA_ORIENTATION=+
MIAPARPPGHPQTRAWPYAWPGGIDGVHVQNQVTLQAARALHGGGHGTPG